MDHSLLPVVGRMAYVAFPEGGVRRVHAKIDTGADGSSVWATDIQVDEAGILSFTLFDKQSPFYTGRRLRRDTYEVVLVRSSNGQEQLRYRVRLSIVIEQKRVNATFTLADRSKNKFPVLIGSKLLRGKFLVDVSRNLASYKKIYGDVKSRSYTEMSRQDPKLFFEEHYLKQYKEKS